jgi:hypothetical protein
VESPESNDKEVNRIIKAFGRYSTPNINVNYSILPNFAKIFFFNLAL